MQTIRKQFISLRSFILNIYNHQLLPNYIIALGVFLRLKHFLENREVWVDEAVLAVNIMSTSFKGLLINQEVLENFAKAPILFSYIEKILVTIFGQHDIVLRLFPFICSIFSLIFFYLLVKKLLSKEGALIALTLFSLLEPLVYYATEIKPYSSDILFTILLTYYSVLYFENQNSKESIVVLALLGVGALLFSFPSIFVLGAISILLIMHNRGYRQLKVYLVLILWVITFSVVYFISYKYMINQDSINNSWIGALYSHELSIGYFNWLVLVVSNFIKFVFGSKFLIFQFVFIVFGAYRLFKNNLLYFLIIALPGILCLMASSFGYYPFKGRVITFLIPLIVIIGACGLRSLIYYPQKGRLVIGLVLGGIFFFQPLCEAGYYLSNKRVIEQNREALNYLNENYREGDSIFLNTSGTFPFIYYVSSLGLLEKIKTVSLPLIDHDDRGVVVGQYSRLLGEKEGREYIGFRYGINVFNNKKQYRDTHVVNKLSLVVEGVPFSYQGHGRTWVFLSRVESNVKNLILESLSYRGRLIDKHELRGAEIYLYDLSH